MADKRVIHVNFADRRRWLKEHGPRGGGKSDGAALSQYYSAQFWEAFDRVNMDGAPLTADIKPLDAGERHAKAVALGREILSALGHPVSREKLADKIHRQWVHEHAKGLTNIRPLSAAHIRKHVLTR